VTSISPEGLVLFRNISLTDADTAGQTGVVDEPSVSDNGQQQLQNGQDQSVGLAGRFQESARE
jgi:hypothetical protein